MGELLAQAPSQDEPLQRALEHVVDAAGELMDMDPAIRSVGVGRGAPGGYEYVALRTSAVRRSTAFAASPPRLAWPDSFAGIPIRVQRSAHAPKVLATVAASAAPGLPEQARQRPLVCGLRVQNVDHDVRSGVSARRAMTVGSIGCFVRLGDGGVALLSNNHVIAGENAAHRGADRMLQPGGLAFTAPMQVAELTDFAHLVPSPVHASVRAGTAHLNIVDAAVARLAPGQAWSQTYLPHRPLGPLSGTAHALLGDSVYMVGAQSGDCHGTVSNVGTVVGPLSYGIGNCWFSRSIVIDGARGLPFATYGDSGAVVVRASDHRVLGLLYAANPTQGWACPIDEVFSALNCSLA